MHRLDQLQTEEIEGWKDQAILGVSHHQLAADYYGRFAFWLVAFPGTVISATAGLMALVMHAPNKDTFIAVFSATSAVISATSAFFNWQGLAEKHRGVGKDFSVLRQRIELWAEERDTADSLAQRAEKFKSARREVQTVFLSIKNEVEPVPAWLRRRADRLLLKHPLESEMQAQLRKRRLEAERGKVEQLRNVEPLTPPRGSSSGFEELCPWATCMRSSATSSRTTHDASNVSAL